MDVVLAQPSIAPNTGAIIRLCANAGARLHLIEPLGFSLDDKLMRRAGLDYHERTSVTIHDTLDDAYGQLRGRWLAFSAKGHTRYCDVTYRSNDVLLFGNERRGLDEEVIASFPSERRVCLPMQPGNRSINVANTASIALYEAWRQHDFAVDWGSSGAEPC